MKDFSRQPVVIQVSGLKKSFRVYNDKSHTLKERLIYWRRGKYAVHNVLRGIDLEVKKGETVALIGQNGSGKSTLLKLLTGIMYPDAGTISIKGKVSSLLELGAGFHPDFSGRENIYNNASIFGLSKKEIDKRYDRIVAFSELAEFIDNPVRTYSSGMYMRLAFSVAINVDADVLLIDEILAVGDASFQKKCFDMIRLLKKQGVTIVLVTHDMGSVERICDRAVWLNEGVLHKQGKTREIVDEYLLNMAEKSSIIEQKEKEIGTEQSKAKELHQDHATEAAPLAVSAENIPSRGDTVSAEAVGESAHAAASAAPEKDKPTEEPGYKLLEKDENGEKVRWGTGAVVLSDVEIRNSKNMPTGLIHSRDKMNIFLHFHVMKPIESLIFGIAVKNTNGDLCISTNSDIRRVEIPAYKVGAKGSMLISIEHCDLSKGSYTLDVAAHSMEGLPYDYQLGKYSFQVSTSYEDVGIFVPSISFQPSLEG